MLGRALVDKARQTGWKISGLARSGGDYELDLTDDRALAQCFREIKPQVVINTAAIVSLDHCERNPGQAYAVNSRAVAIMARLCEQVDAVLVQVSTDQYYCGDGKKSHDESAPVHPLNEYARSKFAGECFALTQPRSLVLRTNIVGHRGIPGRPTFAEWVECSLLERRQLTLFTDAWHSPMHVSDFANATFQLIDRRVHGIVNLAGREVVSKAEFIERFAAAMNIELDWAETGSIHSLGVERADSAGLDVTRAERLLGHSLPSADAAIERLVQTTSAA